MSLVARLCTGALTLALASSLVVPASRAAAAGSSVMYHFKLPEGKSAAVFSNGVAQIYSKDRKSVQTRVLMGTSNVDPDAVRGNGLDKNHVLTELLRDSAQPFADNRVIVVFRDGVGASTDLTSVSKSSLVAMRQAKGRLSFAQVPQYTNDAAVNTTLATIGTDRSERLFSKVPRSTLSAMRSNAQARIGHPLLNISSAYLLHITGAPVRKAVTELLKLPSVAYASPDWRVEPMNSGAIPLRADVVASARLARPALRSAMRVPGGPPPASVPSNYAVSASAQSMLNAPSVDAAAAFDEIDARYHQLPGQGEIITNLSLGDLDDASAAADPKDPCNFFASAYGPTTIVQGGQRYINWPSMPLIPTYTADSSGNLNGAGEVCGVDPLLGEIGLDFTAMAPLPSQLQRPGEQGSGLTDMLGIAPGASYRLVVPASSAPSNSDILAALLGAAQQSPRPNVINASLGFGYDQYGFSSRYLEDDPLMEAVVSSVVQNDNIVMTISSGDGVRTFTTVAIGPNGGSVPTNIVAPGGSPTNVNDVGFSGVPSLDFDSGSIDVGGTTLDDIFARPPQYASSPAVIAQHAYAETRWTGFTNFSSGDGTRVNVSAPSDNILALGHPFGGAADSVSVSLNGGTSASAPETAAAAAVVLQLARLTGHPMTAMDVRAFLATTGSPVFAVPQADKAINVGPQIDVRRAVETLLSRGGTKGKPGVARVAVEQRRNFGNLDGAFLSGTDPNNIALEDPANQDRYQVSWITIAPDWEWLPPGTEFRLYVTGHPDKVIARTPWARALPKTLLGAAGLALASPSTRTMNLTYEALQGTHTIAGSSFSLTFGPTNATHFGVLAPNVPAVVTGATIPVHYDIRDVRGTNNPEIVVSEPGRMSPATGQLFHPVLTIPLTSLSGSVDVPVSSLKGGGMYGVDLIYDSAIGRHSDPAFVRVVTTATSVQPTAPLLARNGSTPGHFLEIPYGSSFQLSYDVRKVPGATGALLEISAAGPGAWRIYNPFNNPGGSLCDNNGVDAGSVYCAPLAGTSGSVTLNANAIGLIPTLNHVVRVIPTKFGVAAGEAGEVSTVTMDGVFATDGGGVQNGFGVRQKGTDGFITSGQQTASGSILTSLDTFDQTSNQIVKTVSSASNSLYFTPGMSSIFGDDVGLIGLQDTATFNSTYNVLNPVAAGMIGSAWTPPAAINNLFLSEAAENSATDIGAFYGYDPNGAPKDNYRVFTSDIVNNTFSPIYDVSGPLQNEGFPNAWGFAENTTTNQGVLLAEDFFANCGAPTLVTVDLTNGAVGSFTGSGAGFPYGIAIDSTTNKAAVPTLCDGGLTIYNLASKTGTEVILPGGFNGFYMENDPKHRQFLVAQTTAPNFGSNNNSLSRVLVYDESGNLLKTKEQFDLFGAFLPIQAHYLQANPDRHSGYLIGPLAQQLEPFNY